MPTTLMSTASPLDRIVPRSPGALRTAGVVALLAPVLFLAWSPGTQLLHVMVLMLIYVQLSVSLQLVTGYAGLLNFGQAAFFGIGAYTAALVALRLLPGHWYAFWVGAPVAGLMAAGLGVLVAAPSLRIKGHYFALVTLGLAEIVRYVYLNSEVTGGAVGLSGIPAPRVPGFAFDSRLAAFFLAYAVTVVAVFVMSRLAGSRLGTAWLTIREDEAVAEAVGVNTTRYKLQVFAISAFFAGVAGAVYAHYITYISPGEFGIDLSTLALTMVVLGGMGSISGAVVGAVALTMLPELLRPIAEYRMLVYGALMVAAMIFRPKGLLGR